MMGCGVDIRDGVSMIDQNSDANSSVTSTRPLTIPINYLDNLTYSNSEYL